MYYLLLFFPISSLFLIRKVSKTNDLLYEVLNLFDLPLKENLIRWPSFKLKNHTVAFEEKIQNPPRISLATTKRALIDWVSHYYYSQLLIVNRACVSLLLRKLIDNFHPHIMILRIREDKIWLRRFHCLHKFDLVKIRRNLYQLGKVF